MAANIHNLICAINPDLYCDPSAAGDVKKILDEKPGDYIAASEKARPKETQYMDFDVIPNYTNPFKMAGLGNPIEKHLLSYDSFGESLEPIYFWLLDTINSDYKDVQTIDKVIDNMQSSTASGHFSEMGQRATLMQKEAMNILGLANQVIKSILNILYDLKEWKIRLALYDKANSKDKMVSGPAILSLKQIWMDTVDMKRGGSALKGLAQQFQYVTLIDGFMAADSLERVALSPEKGGLDLNDRVRRILEQRVGEFFDWLKESEKELRKRFEVEKLYLKSQVNTAQLYARWVKPYLKAAADLEQGVSGIQIMHKATSRASLVNAFNSMLMELVLLVEGKYGPGEDTVKGDLPKLFDTDEFKKALKTYVPIMIVELVFRNVPERSQQGGYGFRGRIEISFTSYSLSKEELQTLKEQVQKDDLGDLINLVGGATDMSLDKLNEELNEYLKDDKKEEKKEEKSGEEKKNGASENPFSALLSIFSGTTKSDKKSKDKKDKPETTYDKIMRSQSIIKARQECRKIYDMYKKAHNIPGF